MFTVSILYSEIRLKRYCICQEKVSFNRNILIHDINIFDMICTYSFIKQVSKILMHAQRHINVVFLIRFPIHTWRHYLGMSAVELAVLYVLRWCTLTLLN